MRIIARDDDEAERIIAGIWLAVERNNLPSPVVRITRQSIILMIELIFEQRNHDEIIRKEALFIGPRLGIV